MPALLSLQSSHIASGTALANRNDGFVPFFDHFQITLNQINGNIF
jgi:hypothetical protein